MRRVRQVREWLLVLGALTFCAAMIDAARSGTPPGKTADAHVNPPQSDLKLELARLRGEGAAHFESGIGLKKALAAFEAAMKLRPQSAIELHNLGTTERKLGNAQRAQQLLTSAVQATPQLPHPAYALGLVHRSRGDTPNAIAAFEAARARAPSAASVHYQLGRLYRETRRESQALQAFVDALQLDPQQTGAMYQLYLYYQEHGEPERAKAMFEEFSRVKRALSLTRRELNDDESELARPVVTVATPVPSETKAPALSFVASDIAAGVRTTSFDVRDVDGDGAEDVVAGTSEGVVRLYRNNGARGWKETASLTVDAGAPVDAVYAEILVRGESFRVIALTRNGIHVSATDLAKPTEKFSKLDTVGSPRAVDFADLDHDGDLDLIVDAFRDVLMNDGAGGLRRSDYFAAEVKGGIRNLSGPMIALDTLGRQATDFVALGENGKRLLLTDELGGRHVPRPFPDLARVREAFGATAADLDNDGRLDLLTSGRNGVDIDYHAQRQQFTPAALPASQRALQDVVLGDFDNDGWKDLIAFDGGLLWWRNVGRRKYQAIGLDTPKLDVQRGSSIAADVDGDGRLDIVTLTAAGSLGWLRNDSKDIGRAARVALTGVRSAPSSLHTVVEIRRGDFYEKYVSDGRTLHLPLGGAEYAEILRISWPNGFVESKLKVDGGQRWAFKESERVSGSCPSVFAWDGGSYRFVTDAFISGPMGVPMGAGRYFPPDHDEYVLIPGEKLRAADDQLRIAITEELREAVFLDRARLIAVDHPGDTELHPNEYLLAGDLPKFALHLTRSALAPARAVDHNGADVTDLVRAVDRRYAAGFRRLQYDGLAESHSVEVELPAEAARAPRLRLFLTGWFHYFESTSLVAAGQRRDLAIVWPQIEAWDRGEWRQVMTVGIPSGKDKTVVADLTGRLPAAATRLRIRTNLALYWDRIALDTAPAPSAYTMQSLDARSARLRFRGFSDFERHTAAGMPQPERFVYDALHLTAPWNPLAGRYTRFGPVEELLEQVDSRMAVFGSGDELSLEFDASALAPPPRGWRRDYLLHLDGFVKDGDRYTAHPGALEPIPYAGMTAYPYTDVAAAARVFNSPAYRDYVVRYQTREPLRFTGVALATPTSAPRTDAVLSGAAGGNQ